MGQEIADSKALSWVTKMVNKLTDFRDAQMDLVDESLLIYDEGFAAAGALWNKFWADREAEEAAAEEASKGHQKRLFEQYMTTAEGQRELLEESIRYFSTFKNDLGETGPYATAVLRDLNAQLEAMLETTKELNREHDAEGIAGPTGTGYDYGVVAMLLAQTETEKLEESYQELAETISGYLSPALEAIGEGLATGEWESFTDAAKGAIADVLRMLAKLWTARAVGAFAALNIPQGFGFSAAAAGALVAAGAVTAMAEGGIVTRPTLALIGERGPEKVTPLGRGGGAPIIINVQGSIITEGQLVSKIAGVVGRMNGGY